MSKRVKLLLAGGGVLLLLLLALYLRKTDTSEVGRTNSVQSISEVVAEKTFQSKTEAYNALVNEKETFYNRPASAFKQPAAAPQPTVPAAQPVAESSKAQDRQFDEAYKQVERNVRDMYDNTAPVESSGTSDVQEMNTATGANAAPETAEDHRRKAMLEDWGMEKKSASSEEGVQASMYRAVIHGTQQVKVGQTALFRTKEPIRYNTVIVPANTLLSGVVAISQNRLSIKINSVRIDNGIFSLPLEVYGSDGIPGIPLNYDQIGQIANDQASTTTVQEVSSAVSRYGGTLGRVAGSLVSGVGSQVRSAKNMEVKLIDNQSVILKIIQ